jgi:hypothetical protein
VSRTVTWPDFVKIIYLESGFGNAGDFPTRGRYVPAIALTMTFAPLLHAASGTKSR